MKASSVASHYNVCLPEVSENNLRVGKEQEKMHESILCC